MAETLSFKFCLSHVGASKLLIITPRPPPSPPPINPLISFSFNFEMSIPGSLLHCLWCTSIGWPFQLLKYSFKFHEFFVNCKMCLQNALRIYCEISKKNTTKNRPFQKNKYKWEWTEIVCVFSIMISNYILWLTVKWHYMNANPHLCKF